MAEATLRIDTRAFKEACEDFRAKYAAESILQSFDYRDAFKRFVDADDYRIAAAAIEVVPVIDRSYAGHLAALQCAARPLMQFGATDAQMRLLASLYAKAGEAVEHMTRLTKLEASAMIDMAKRDAARRAD